EKKKQRQDAARIIRSERTLAECRARRQTGDEIASLFPATKWNSLSQEKKTEKMLRIREPFCPPRKIPGIMLPLCNSSNHARIFP
ncbi:MAG: hypothetical protein QF593_10095, partial [Nitrospinota bacterium]|nr:hypothetical protein [Nitrospinota bacterium]